MDVWLPEPGSLERPIYLSLAEKVVEALQAGKLAEGARLPTHRELSFRLKVSAQTVSRAYEELARRGLVTSSVGRGSFVKHSLDKPAYPHSPERSETSIDLSILKPVSDSTHLEHMRRVLQDLAVDLPLTNFFSFRPNNALARHRSIGVDWLRSYGIEVDERNLMVTNGATPGMTLALMSVLSPGSTLLSEEIGHHTLNPLATYLGSKLHAVKIDSEGICPDSLEQACLEHNARALFIMPGPISPTVSVMSNGRRAEIAEIARRHGLFIVENDPLGALVDRGLLSFVELAPERTFYITSLTKSLMPGLRTGYVVVPSSLIPAITNRSLVTTWMATPLIAEIASRWIEDGTAKGLIDWQRKALAERHKLAAELLGGVQYLSHRQSLHIWLPLPKGHTEDGFVANARLRGVGVARGSAFTLSQHAQPPAIRISVGSTRPDELRRGLEIISAMLTEEPEPILHRL
ncbi:PLP-dependent aminotransferase family protein [Mesorhizobium ventifaucium]|uniref:Transcriptional regulator GabR of GABA utilization (GntR family with aminotransferase-like domain) n=1 Tax=Mesorhizobium ventifaucium TaxID=666020 RepID=A0ABN8JGT1_9HYPH|nr:PLP-dependent aminotransferase family protein [Mesorhizobium ventifaucium]CAH2396875.1 Transcriptional regulator GabR of GABA utilization (GntR family with aminotransferase-like domain) [Mesorhizobium ventifaucium]